MGVFDPRQGQVLPSPVTNFYKGKAIRQELADAEQMAELRGLQIDEAKYQQSPERRKTQEEIIQQQLDASRMALDKAEIELGEATMSHMAKMLTPVTSAATNMALSGDVEGGVEYFNKEIQRLLPELPKKVREKVEKGAGPDHVYSPEEMINTKIMLGMWLDKQGVERDQAKFIVDGKPVQGSYDKAGNYYDGNGNLVTGNIQPYDKPGVEIKNMPPDQLRDPRIIDFFNKGATEAEQSYAAVNAANNALEAIDEGIFAGLGRNAAETGAKVLALMADKDNPPEVIAEAIETLENSQFYDSQGGVLVGQIIRLFGAGTGLSDADREYAAGIAGALRDMEVPALKRILTQVKKTKMREVRSWNAKVDKISESDPEYAEIWKITDVDAEIEALLEEYRKK